MAPATLSFLRIPASGLSNARNIGIAVAHGRTICCIDDDCTMAADYLVHVPHVPLVAGSGEAETGLFLRGGRVELLDATDMPFTIRRLDRVETYSPDIHPGGFVPGCNFVSTRAVFDLLGPFDTRFGAGSPMLAGEDTDYTIRAFLAGVRVECSPDLVVHHGHGRKTREAVLMTHRFYSYGNGAIYAKWGLRQPWLLKHAYWMVRNALRESRGGPRYDPACGLSYRTIVADGIRGFFGYLGKVVIGRAHAARRWSEIVTTTGTEAEAAAPPARMRGAA